MNKRLIAAATLAVALSPLAPMTASAATIQVVSGQQRAFALNGNTVGQSFTAVDTNLTSFGFQFVQFLGDGNLAAPNLAYNFTLRSGAGLTGSVITTRTFTIPTTISSTSPVWIDFDITGSTVSAGQVYTGVLTSGNLRYGLVMGPDINIYTGQELSGDAYAGGRAYYAQEVYPNCAQTGNCDLNFRVTGTTAVAAVPEPASWAMMLGGFGLLGGVLRRRRATLATA